MPSKSEAQHHFMEAAAHNPKFAAAHHIGRKVAQDFVNHDKTNKDYKKRKKVGGTGK
jgi:hypothetical protein